MLTFKSKITELTRLEPKYFYKTLKTKPLKCLPLAIWLKRELTNSFKAKKIAILPLYGFKSSVVSNIKFDTTCISSFLFGSNILNKVSKNISSLKDAMWKKFFSANGFNMMRRLLRKNEFVGEIVTNGHSCTLTFADTNVTPAPVLSKNAYKPPPGAIPIALNNPTVVPTVVPTESIQQSTVIPTETNQPHLSTVISTQSNQPYTPTVIPKLVANSNSTSINNSNKHNKKRKSANNIEPVQEEIIVEQYPIVEKNNTSPIIPNIDEHISVTAVSPDLSSSSTSVLLSAPSRNKKKKKNESNKRKSNKIIQPNQESIANSQVDPTLLIPLSNNKKKRNNELSDEDKQKLDFANVMYRLEVDGDEDDDSNNFTFDRKDNKLKSIAELEEFADKSFLDKNAPYIPYIHQLSSNLKEGIVANNNLKYAAFDLGVRDIFKMLTIQDNDQKFCKPTPRNSTTLNYSSKARNYNLKVEQRAKWLDKYKKKKTVVYENVTYSIKKFESEIVRKQLRFTDSSYQDFLAYSKTKTKFESVLKKFHESTYVKSLKHQAYQSKQKEYAEIAKRIKETLGRKDASDCLLIVGDVSISTHLKGNRPACWKGMIRYLKKEGFKILRIEEYHSSKLCCNCRKFNESNVSNENWLKCKRTYGKQKGKILPVFALFKCACCRSIKQRDLNAVVNMYEYGIHQLHGKTMKEFVIPDGVREKWLLNSRNYSHTAFKDKYRCY